MAHRPTAATAAAADKRRQHMWSTADAAYKVLYFNVPNKLLLNQLINQFI